MMKTPIQRESKKKESHIDKSSMGATERQQSRISKAYNILDHVNFTTPTTAEVLSSDGKTTYWVTLSPLDNKHVCTCPDHTIRLNVCKHIIATITKANEVTVKKIDVQ